MKLKHTIKIDNNVSMDFLLEEVCTKEDILRLMNFLKTFVKNDEKPQKITTIRTHKIEDKYIKVKEMMDREHISFSKAYISVTGHPAGGTNRSTAKKYGIDINFYKNNAPKNNFGKIFIVANQEKIKAHMKKTNNTIVETCVWLFGMKPAPSDYKTFHQCGI